MAKVEFKTHGNRLYDTYSLSSFVYSIKFACQDQSE